MVRKVGLSVKWKLGCCESQTKHEDFEESGRLSCLLGCAHNVMNVNIKWEMGGILISMQINNTARMVVL